MKTLKVAIGAGHHNARGLNGEPVFKGAANPYEYDMNGQKARALFDLLSTDGRFDIRCYTPEHGLGDFPGDYNDAAAQVAQWADQGWLADVMLELHSEGSAPEKRGAFVLFPDHDGDVDKDARDHGAVFAQELQRVTGIPPCTILTVSPGVSSETQSGVGLQGYRLGVFAVTARLNYHTSRLIFEQGAHSNPQDRAIMDAPGFPAKAAQATRAALLAFGKAVYQLDTGTEDPNPPAGNLTSSPGKLLEVKPGDQTHTGGALIIGLDGGAHTLARDGRAFQYASPNAKRSAESFKKGQQFSLTAYILPGDGIPWVQTSGGWRFRADDFGLGLPG